MNRYNFVENDLKIEVNKEKNLFYFNVRSRYLREFVFFVKELQKLRQELDEKEKEQKEESKEELTRYITELKEKVDGIEMFNAFSSAECIQHIYFDEDKVSELEYCKILPDSDEFITYLAAIESKAKKVIENRKVNQMKKIKTTELKSGELCTSNYSDEDVVSNVEAVSKKTEQVFDSKIAKQSNDDYLSDDSSGTYCSD